MSHYPVERSNGRFLMSCDRRRAVAGRSRKSIWLVATAGAEHGTPANGACKARPPPAPFAAFACLAGPPCCAASGVRLMPLPFSALRLASKSSISWGNVGQSPMSSGSFFRIAFTHSLLAISFPVRCVAVLKPGFPHPGMRRWRSEGGVAQGAPAAMPAFHECSGPHERSTQLSNR